MKLVNFLLITFMISANLLHAETEEVTITTGVSYQNTVWYSLTGGVVKEAPKDNWDLAFQTGQNGAIHLNCQKGYELFEIVDSDEFSWDATIDTTDFRNSKNFVSWLNSEGSWNVGAFNTGKNGFEDNGEFGWGAYDLSDHGIKGNKLFMLITPDKQVKKIFISKLLNRKYDFKYADLDGSNEVYATVNKNDRPDVSFIYFDFATNAILTEAREPNSSDWDLVFGKYTIAYPTGEGTFMPYPVTGIKQNQTVLAVQLDDVDVDNVAEPADELFEENITIIGSDWKKYNMSTGVYEITQNRVYFLKDVAGILFKLVLKDFSGSQDGKYVFDQTRMGSSVSESLSNLNLAIYPNVIEKNETFNVVLSDEIPQEYNLSIVDLAGNKVMSQIVESDYLKTVTLNSSTLSSGVYFITLSNSTGIISNKIIVR